MGTAANGNSFGSSSFKFLGGFITNWGNVVVVVVVVVTTVVCVVGAKENCPTVVCGATVFRLSVGGMRNEFDVDIAGVGMPLVT